MLLECFVMDCTIHFYTARHYSTSHNQMYTGRHYGTNHIQMYTGRYYGTSHIQFVKHPHDSTSPSSIQFSTFPHSSPLFSL